MATTAIWIVATGASAQAKDGDWRAVETVRYNQPGGPTFVLTTEDNPASDDTPRLRISRSGRPDFIVSTPGGLVPTISGLVGSVQPEINLVRSKFVYLTQTLTDRVAHPFLIVFGNAYASDPGSIRILRLPPTGAPEYALSEDRFELVDVMHHKGATYLVGRPTLSEMVGPCRKTYDPEAVLRLAPASQRFIYSLRLSKAYNLAHLGRWAGPRSREGITVDTCKGARASKP